MGSRGDFAARVAEQGGVISARRAREEFGVGKSTLHRLLRRGWRRLLPGIYAAPGVPDFSVQLRAALLWGAPDAVASHGAAGVLWKMSRVPPKVQITIPLR